MSSFGGGIARGLESIGQGIDTRREREYRERLTQQEGQAGYLREVLRIAAEQGDSETIGKVLQQYGQFQNAPVGKKGVAQRQAAYQGTQGLIEQGRTVTAPTGETAEVPGVGRLPYMAQQKRPLFKTREEMTAEDARAAGKKAKAISDAQQPGKEALERQKEINREHLKTVDMENRLRVEADRHQHLVERLGIQWKHAIEKPTLTRAQEIAAANGREAPNEEDKQKAAEQINDEWEDKARAREDMHEKTRQSIETARKQIENYDSLIAHRQAQAGNKFPPNVKFRLEQVKGEISQAQRVIDERSRFVDEHFSDPTRQAEIQQAYATINEKRALIESKMQEVSGALNQYGQGAPTSATPPRTPQPATNDPRVGKTFTGKDGKRYRVTGINPQTGNPFVVPAQ